MLCVYLSENGVYNQAIRGGDQKDFSEVSSGSVPGEEGRGEEEAYEEALPP